MVTHFIEATNQANWGKFMLGRFDDQEAEAKSHLPGAKGGSLFTTAGQRKMRPGMTLVLDLQTGEGAAFTLRAGGTLPPAEQAKWELSHTHQIWVCPMFEPFLGWLAEQNFMRLDELPHLVELDAEPAFYGHRRDGAATG